MFEGQWNAFLCLCVCSVKAVVMIVRYYISMTTLVKHSGAHSSKGTLIKMQIFAQKVDFVGWT